MWADISRHQRQYWELTLVSLVRSYGIVVDAQLAIAEKVLQATTGVFGRQQAATRRRGAGASTTSQSDASVVEAVEQRIRAGLTPPAEAHLVQYRSKIDWSRYPSWARPADPEMFDGCGHEG